MYPDYLVHFNPNHDPKTGQFAPGTGSGEATVNKIGARLKKADLLDINHKEYKTESGPVYKRMKAAADTGLKALLKLGDTDVKLDSPEHWDYWFLFEDQTYGQAQVADLANKGKSKEQIKQVIKDSVEFTLRDYNDEFSEIPGVYSLYLFNEEADYMPFGDADSFIDACIEVAKENRQVKHSGVAKFGNYLCHYNKNHSPKNGQFTSGDGDGDGISNDNAHRSKEGKKSSSEQIKTKAGVDILCNKVTKQLRSSGTRLAKNYSYEKFMKNSGFRKNADEMYDKYVSKELQKKISRKEFTDKLMTAMYDGMTSNTTTKVNWGRTAAIAALTGGRVLSIKRETVPVKHGELMHFNPYHDSLGRFDDAPGGLNRPGRFQEDLNYYFGSNPSIDDFHISDDVMNDMKDMLHEIGGYTSTEVVKMVNPDTGEVETFLHRVRGDQE